MKGEKLVQFSLDAAELTRLDLAVRREGYRTRSAYLRDLIAKEFDGMKHTTLRDKLGQRKALKQFADGGNADEAAALWRESGGRSGDERLADDFRS